MPFGLEKFLTFSLPRILIRILKKSVFPPKDPYKDLLFLPKLKISLSLDFDKSWLVGVSRAAECEFEVRFQI